MVALVVGGAAVLPWWAARRASGTGTELPPLPVGRGGWLAAAAAVALLLGFGVARWSPAFAWAAP